MSALITFDDVMKECNNEPNFVISPGCKTEIKGFFTILRVKKDSLPEGWYKYDIRHSETGAFITLEPNVWANHAGTLVTQTNVDFGKKGYRNLNGRGGYSFL